jgi:hypothetical protein
MKAAQHHTWIVPNHGRCQANSMLRRRSREQHVPFRRRVNAIELQVSTSHIEAAV